MGILVKIYHFLFGYYVLQCEEEYRTKLINIFFVQKITAYPTKENAFLIDATCRKKVEEAIAPQNFKVGFSEKKGVPSFFCKYRHRIGLFIGAFAVAILLMASTRVVWRIEVSGNEKLSDKEIIADLEEIGFGEGSYIRKTDFSELSTALRLKHSEIAHADIYCVGTVAQVRIREADVPSKEEQDPSLAHLIASRDAVIESFDVQHGTVVSEVGRVVKKGEMLVSGIVAGAHGDLLLHAEGAVYGRVTEQIVVEIPYQQEIETVKGYEKGKITLFFFGKAINIQKNGGNLPVTYGTIVERENWTLPNGCTLPISLVEEKIVLLESQSVTLSHTDALRLACAELKGKITSKLENGRLVSKHTVAEATEDGCILKCTLTYITCISETKTVDVIQ